jgi:hypothetical protein
MAYRDEIDALAHRHAALERDVADRTRELEESRRLLDDARARARLPVLDNLRVASPCAADWSRMTGDDRARHCDDCNKTVYNLSGMTRDEAHALLRERGDLCARFYRRADGTILTADCTVGVSRRRRRRIVVAGAAVAVAGALLATRRGDDDHGAAHVEVSSPEELAPLSERVEQREAPPPPPPAPQHSGTPAPDTDPGWTMGFLF